MKKLAALSTAALLGLGAVTASAPAQAQWRWRHHNGGAIAAGAIGGFAAGALLGAAASNAYAAPYGYYDYGYAPAYGYGYAAPVAYYDEPAPVVTTTRVVRRVAYAPVYRRRVVRVVRPAVRTRVVQVYDDAPVVTTRVVRRVPAYSWNYAPAYGYGYGGYAPAYWGGPSVSVGFGVGRRGWW